MTTAPVEQLVKVPEGVTYAQAAAATDAGATAYHAVVTVGEVKTGMKVGIIGVGRSRSDRRACCRCKGL